MAVLLSVVFGLLISSIHVAGLTLCDTDGTLEVVENKADNVFTCTGFSSTTNQVSWYLILGTTDNDLAVCKRNLLCTNNINSPYEASRPAADRSTLTVNATGQLNLIQGRAIVCDESADTTRCRLDVIAVPNVTCNSNVSTMTSSPWTVTVNCNVLGAFSNLSRYNCILVQTSPSIKNVGSADMTVTSSSGKYKSGTCEVIVPFPSGDGTYGYNMTVSPGKVDIPIDIEIRRPSTPPTHTCPTYVQEFQGVSCTCTTTDLGQPPGVVRWANTSTTQLSLSNVKKEQNGTKYKCEVIWNRQSVVSEMYALQVAYGPSSVSIQPNPAFPLDTNGHQELTLSCLATGSNPAPNITWPMRHINSTVDPDMAVKFTPKPPGDDKSEFVCQAENPVTGTSKQATVALDLNYPPSKNPVIANQSNPSSSNGRLYKGDNATFKCAVTGGKPLNATTVNFNCSGKPDRPDIVESSGVTSSVTFTNLNANNTCTCRTKWYSTNWYDKTEAVDVVVITPPSTPVIDTPNNDYPFIANVTQSATLTCHSTDQGHPPSTYTWPIQHGGLTGTDGQGRDTLTFDTVTKELNGKRVICNARNLFTDNRQPVPDGNLTLEVYFKPEISFSPAEGGTNQCHFMSDDTCEVTEGEKVHILCSANSNPPPANYSWQTDSGMSDELLVVSANRTLHNGIHKCTVTTGLGNYGKDTRLPLLDVMSVTVLVKYTPSVSSFEVNSSLVTNLTVNASDVLHFTCQAVGRPPPEIKVLHADHSVIAMTPQGPPSLHDTPSTVSGELTTRCQDTGVYSCTANNSVGGTSGPTVSIFVQCQPEAVAGGGSVLPTINFGTQAVHVNFSVRAYPVPWLKQVKFFKQQPKDTDTSQNVSEKNVAMQCVSAGSVSSRVTCQLTVDNVMSDNAGFYQAFIGNEFGNLKLQFEVKVNATSSPPVVGSDFPVAAVVGGIAAAIVVIVIVVAVVLIRRRRKGKAQKSASPDLRRNGAREQPDEVVMVTNCLCGSSRSPAPKGPQPSTSHASPYEDIDIPDGKPTVMPKPTAMSKPSVMPKPTPKDGASAAQASSTGDVYATVNKRNAAQSNPQDISDVYAVVSKKKKEPDVPPSATPGTKKQEKPKGGKNPAQKKSAQKEKQKKQAKKEDKQALDPAQSTSSDEVVMVTNSLYESSGFPAPKGPQPSTSHASPYEDIDIPDGNPTVMAKPTVMPKPSVMPKPTPKDGASAAQASSIGDVYATVNKGNAAQSNPQDISDVYAVVSKKKKEPDVPPSATPETKKQEKPKGGKKPAPKKPAQKEKQKKQAKKEDKQELDPAQSTSSGAIYCNLTPLKMSPPEPEGSVYENYAFQIDDADANETKQEPEPEASRTVNQDGLVYTTVAFTQSQLEKENEPPPVRVETEYVGLDFSQMTTP